jgi:leucyl aminopeptidase
MKFNFSSSKINELSTDAVVGFVNKTDKISGPFLKALDDAASGSLGRAIDSEEFTGKDGEILSILNPKGFRSGRLLLVGLGEIAKLDPDSFRRAMGHISRNTGLTQARTAALFFGQYSEAEYVQAAVEGYFLGSFKQLDFKTGEAARDKSRLASIEVVTDQTAKVKRAAKATEKAVIIAEGQLLVRRLAQTPSGHLTPRIYAAEIKKLSGKYGFSCRVLDEKGIAKEKMGAFLGVAAGSEEPPRFMILEHKGGGAKQKPIVLVGKGVTFDSGGISLKPGLKMHEMKQDMAGSAVVVAALVTATRLGIRQNVVGLIPATENMPSGRATRPGDILTSRKGKTIEIINTDAEGRLILADALDYANEFDPQAVIDIATLTGAALMILGYAGAPILGNNDKLLERLMEASKVTAERVWTLPIWDDHREQMKSPIADLVNSGGRPAGTITATAFLENFIGDWPWAHIDIASVDLEQSGRPYVPQGASGFGLRLLIELLSQWKRL